MSDDDERAPDFAMQRAVEILARVYETNRAKRERDAAQGPPPPIDRPVVLANERLTFGIGTTTRAEVERAFGVAFAYPMRGWHTYAASEDGERRFLSLFYDKGQTLIALEYYIPKTAGAPSLRAQAYGFFRLTPGDVALGAATATLDERYVTAVGGPAPVVYAEAHEVRFPGGVAYVMGNDGRVERLGLYTAT